jgi:hypothetical protein
MQYQIPVTYISSLRLLRNDNIIIIIEYTSWLFTQGHMSIGCGGKAAKKKRSTVPLGV